MPASDSNVLLKLIRHSVCSHLVRKSRGMEDDPFSLYAGELLDGMQNLRSIQSICAAIRMGKELTKERPKTTSKDVDFDTGEVMVNQISVKKDVWSIAIPTTIAEFKKHLIPLFHCPALMEDVLNPNNKMVLAGKDTTVTVMSESGTVVREINVVSQLVPLLDTNNVANTQTLVNQLFSLEQGTLLYLSSGPGRGEEIKDKLSFADGFRLHFNMLRFHLRSHKGVNHGVNRNEWVTHFVSPSLSRLIAVLNLCVYPAARQHPGLTVPSQELAKDAAREMFQLIFGLGPTTSTKDYREICIQIVNYIAPVSLAPTSTPPEYARQCHHGKSMHDANYSSNAFRRTSDGRIEKSEIQVARDYHEALGERKWNSDKIDIDEDWIPEDMYHKALQRGLCTPSVSCNHHQMIACQFLDNHSIRSHAMVFRPPGTGKSFTWDGILLARYLRGSKNKRFLVLSPHSALLAQHVQQSQQFFDGTSLQVTSITGSNIDTANTLVDFDLCYISIHAFAKLADKNRELLQSWDVGSIYIDECHLMFCELFRIGTSWNSLQDIQRFGTKLVCLSATVNEIALKMIAHYMGIKDNYKVIGDAATYTLPNVAILLKKVKDVDLINCVVDEIKAKFADKTSSNYALHVMTMTRSQATTIADKVSSNEIRCTWVTSDDSQSSRTEKMKDWASGELDVLVSTMNCGFDCGLCKEAFVVGGVRSVADAIQSIGRIRPRQQNGIHTPVTFWLTERSWQQWNDNKNTWTPWEDWHKSGWEESVDVMRANKYFDCFEGNIDEERKARNKLQFLYSHVGVKSIFEGNGCLRTALYQHLGVISKSNCQMCSVCTSTDNFSKSVNEAKQRQSKKDQDRAMVNDVLKTLSNKCFACNDEECDGMKCIMTLTQSKNKPAGLHRQHWCTLCFGNTSTKNSLHTTFDKNNNNKIPLCQVKQLSDHGNMCSNCCMIIDSSVQARGKKVQHPGGVGKCIYKLRIRRILLEEIKCQYDRGGASSRLLKRLINNEPLWYDTMAKNIKKLKKNQNRS